MNSLEAAGGRNKRASSADVSGAEAFNCSTSSHLIPDFERVDKQRRETCFRQLEAESQSSDAHAPGYIDGSTALFEQTAKADHVFNRMFVYRRNSLHSAGMDDHHIAPPDRLAGRCQSTPSDVR
ncbi:MAG: DUF6445 family protein [Rhodanobacter sp.]